MDRLAAALGVSEPERQALHALAQPVEQPPEEGASAFGHLLARHRQSANLRRVDLASKALISPRAIGDLERTARAPRRQTTELLADALELAGPERDEFIAAARTAASRAGPPAWSLAGVGDHGVPRYSRSLVGRDALLARLIGLLDGPANVVLLCGPGGVGKTRLAAELCRRDQHRWQRVVFVPVATVTTARQVLDAVTLSLGLAGAGPADSAAAVRAVLGRERVLLCIDNLEQVVAAEPLVAELLVGGGPGRLLITCRRRLHLLDPLLPDGVVAHEVVVPPLALEREPGSAQSPAAELFIQRAVTADPEWHLAVSAGTVEAICHRVDGLPLAIELLAAWVRAISVPRILARLDGSIDVVSASGPRGESRHRSLGTVLDASLDLLEDPVRITFGRLAVFAAGFELEAAESVCGADNLDVLAAAAELRDASLLQAERGSDGEVRFRYLQVVRRHALDRLAGSGEAPLIRARHAAWTSSLVLTAAPRLIRDDQGIWLDRLDRTVDDVRAALDWFAESGDLRGWVRLAGASWRYWYLRSLLREGAERLSAAFARVRADDHPACDPADAAQLAYGTGILTYLCGEARGAEQFFDDARHRYEGVGDRAGVANVLNNLGMIATYRGDLATARQLHEQAQQEAHSSGDGRSIAVTEINLAKLAEQEGDLAEASRLATAARAAFDRLGDGRGAADADGLLGQCARQAGDLTSARTHLQQALAVFEKLGDSQGIVPALLDLAILDLDVGDPGAAAALAERASALTATMDDPWSDARLALVKARLAAAGQDWPRAIAELDRAATVGERVGDAELRATIQELRASWSASW